MSNLEEIKKSFVENVQPSFIKFDSSFSVYDFNAYTLQELICQLFGKMKEVINQSNNYTDLVVKLIDWVQREGLKHEVMIVLDRWKEEGVIDEIINENIFNMINEEIENLKDSDAELSALIETESQTREENVTSLSNGLDELKNDVNNVRGEMTQEPRLKIFTLKNEGDEMVPDSNFSDEELSTMRVETYFIKVEYKQPFPSSYKPGSVIANTFALGNNKWDVKIKDVTNYGFSFCLIDTTTGEKVNNADPVSKVYATYVSFIHASSKKVQAKGECEHVL